MINDDEVEKAVDYLRDNARKAAQAKADRLYMEEYRKSVKSQIMREHLSQPLGAQEREAYADPRYKTHLEALRTAIEGDEYHRWMLAAAEAKIEAWRTQSSNNRGLVKLG